MFRSIKHFDKNVPYEKIKFGQISLFCYKHLVVFFYKKLGKLRNLLKRILLGI